MSDNKITPEERELAESVGLSPEPDPVPNDRQGAHDRLLALVEARKQFGLRKYQTLLQAGNGRNHLADALDEIVDLAVYLQTELDERDLIARRAWQEGYTSGHSRAMRRMSDEPHVADAENPYPDPYSPENPHPDPYAER